jgi:hypothetical protein
MAKQSGLGDNLYVAGYDLSGDIGSLDTISGSLAVIEVTGIDKSAYERLGGKRDGKLAYSSYFNDAAGQEHPRLSLLPTTDQILTYCRGTALGGSAACINAKQLNYDGNRAADGAFTFKVEADANGFGLEWGVQLTAGKRTDATPTSPATGVDFTAVSTAFGWQAYLQVLAITGTSVTVTLQDSADNSAFANLAGGAFNAAAAVGAQRLAGASNATVRRYVRAITTGAFSNAVFSVVFVPNTTAISF